VEEESITKHYPGKKMAGRREIVQTWKSWVIFSAFGSVLLSAESRKKSIGFFKEM
tara:strand:- start:335 stop:499 length:165 start_codon:yes stop_codon:yes gene_type:complete